MESSQVSLQMPTHSNYKEKLTYNLESLRTPFMQQFLLIFLFDSLWGEVSTMLHTGVVCVTTDSQPHALISIVQLYA
jgi:hypothetical protein